MTNITSFPHLSSPQLSFPYCVVMRILLVTCPVFVCFLLTPDYLFIHLFVCLLICSFLVLVTSCCSRDRPVRNYYATLLLLILLMTQSLTRSVFTPGGIPLGQGVGDYSNPISFDRLRQQLQTGTKFVQTLT